MRNTRTFPVGGVHPYDYKSLTNRIPIKNAPVPAEPIIPMHQHMGGPAECVVQEGDEVREGMLIGKASGAFSANIHSPVPGTVKEIREIYLPTGVKSKAVVVEFKGEFDRSGKSRELKNWKNTGASDLLGHIRQQGIVGLGGATFPTPLKYIIREGSAVEYFVANGVECEPFLTADHRLMLEKTDEVLTGIEIIRKIITPEHVLIGVEENKPDAIAVLEQAIGERELDIEVVPLEVKYPQGDEKQLIKSLIDREVPSGGLPLDIGAVVSNVGTIHAIYEAVVLNKPLYERVVTVSGSIVKSPANLKVRLGTMVGDLIEECGGFTETPVKLVCGGPMMGFALMGMDTPVTKGVSGVIALSRKEFRGAAETACLECGRCIRACPFGLSATTLYKWIEHGEYAEALAEGLLDCKECGCCSYVCPARIPLVQGMKLGKLMSRKKKA